MRRLSRFARSLRGCRTPLWRTAASGSAPSMPLTAPRPAPFLCRAAVFRVGGGGCGASWRAAGPAGLAPRASAQVRPQLWTPSPAAAQPLWRLGMPQGVFPQPQLLRVRPAVCFCRVSAGPCAVGLRRCSDAGPRLGPAVAAPRAQRSRPILVASGSPTHPRRPRAAAPHCTTPRGLSDPANRPAQLTFEVPAGRARCCGRVALGAVGPPLSGCG